MNATATGELTQVPPSAGVADLDHIQHSIEHAAHYLPSQGPIEVFVHHNTLHAFEDMPFEAGVKAGGSLFGCHAFLPEEDVSAEARARPHPRRKTWKRSCSTISATKRTVSSANFGTRFALRLAMLQFPLRSGPSAELRWLIADTDALRRFRGEVPPEIRERIIAETSHWVMRDLRNDGSPQEKSAKRVLQEVGKQFNQRSMESWSEKTWETFVLNFLWRVCQNGVQMVEDQFPQASPRAQAVQAASRSAARGHGGRCGRAGE